MTVAQETEPKEANREAPQPLSRAPMSVTERGLSLRNLDDMWRFATCLAKSGLAPKGIDTPESILIATQMGMELGLTPMAAIQNIAVINGRPAIWGDAQLAVCRACSAWDEKGFGESWEGDENADDFRAVVTCQRRGGNPCTRTFSVKDAKKAGLWGKQGPWSQYPKRMLQMRARSYALRDTFGDVLRGFHSVEEVRDGGLKEVEGTVVGEAAVAPVDKSVALAAKLKSRKAEGSASEGNPAGSSRSSGSEVAQGSATAAKAAESAGAAPAPETDPKADLVNALTDLTRVKTLSFAQVEEARAMLGEERFAEALKDAKLTEKDIPGLKAPAIKTLLLECISVVKG